MSAASTKTLAHRAVGILVFICIDYIDRTAICFHHSLHIAADRAYMPIGLTLHSWISGFR